MRDRKLLRLFLLLWAVLPVAAFGDGWQERRGTSPMTDISWYTLLSEAAAGPQDDPDKTPALAVSCVDSENVVAFYSPWELQPSIGEATGQRIRLRFDDTTPEDELWHVGDDRHTLIAPAPEVKAEQLRRSKRLLVQFTTVHDGEKIVELPVDGFDTRRGDLSTACQWPRFDLVVVEDRPLPGCSIPSPSFSGRLKRLLDTHPRTLDLDIEAKVGSQGRLEQPTAAPTDPTTGGLISSELLRVVSLGRCPGREPGDTVRLRFQFKTDV